MIKTKHPRPIKASVAKVKNGKSLISPDLAALRHEIDILDQNIWSLLSKRFALTRKVAKIKQKLNISVYDAKREQSVLAKIKAKMSDPEIAGAIGRLYKELFAVSKKYQQSLTKNKKSSATKN